MSASVKVHQNFPEDPDAIKQLPVHLPKKSALKKYMTAMAVSAFFWLQNKKKKYLKPIPYFEQYAII